MRVTSQVVQNVFRTAEGRLGVNDPLLPGDGCEKRLEVLFVGEWSAVPKKRQLMIAKRMAQAIRELAPKTRLSTFTGKKKRGPEPIQ